MSAVGVEMSDWLSNSVLHSEKGGKNWTSLK